MKMSKKEEKYRIRFISEYHLNKAEQKMLDKAKVDMDIPYKEIYQTCKNGKSYFFLISIGAGRMAKAQREAGISAEELQKASVAFATALKESEAV